MKKILLAEDDLNLSMLISKKLSKEGFEIVEVKNGKEALEKLKEKPDLLLLDIGMPEIDGFGVLEQKNKDPELKNICVIIISNSGDPVEVKRIKNLGAMDYLIKVDFDPDELVEKVKKCFQSELIQDVQGKVLIVEDESFIRELLARKLREKEIEVLEATTGEEGMDKIKNEKPSLVLLDLLLPGIDGFEVLKNLQGDSSAPPVIVISNLGEETDIDRAMSLGAKDYAIKAHINPDEIVEKVKRYLTKTSA